MSTTSARLYETDFYGWIQSQAGVLRSGNFASLDLDNLIEEIESMGKSQHRALESRLEVLVMHLLKWQFQPKRRGTSWELSIEDQRDRIAKLLKENPSLKSRVQAAFEEVYRFAVREAARETKIKKETFPSRCPWTFEQVMSPDFWPESAMGTT